MEWARAGFSRYYGKAVLGRDERPRSSAVGARGLRMQRVWKKSRLTGDGSPYLWGMLFWVGMSVPAHPYAIGWLVGYRGWLKLPHPEDWNS